MARFTIYEERHDVYTATIEADSLEHALKLYAEDDEEVFGNQWEQEGSNGIEINEVHEEKPDGTVEVFLFENGEPIPESND